MKRTPFTVITDAPLIIREPTKREADEFEIPAPWLIIIDSNTGRARGMVRREDLFDIDGNRFGD